MISRLASLLTLILSVCGSPMHPVSWWNILHIPSFSSTLIPKFKCNASIVSFCPDFRSRRSNQCDDAMRRCVSLSLFLSFSRQQILNDHLSGPYRLCTAAIALSWIRLSTVTRSIAFLHLSWKKQVVILGKSYNSSIFFLSSTLLLYFNGTVVHSRTAVWLLRLGETTTLYGGLMTLIRNPHKLTRALLRLRLAPSS